MAGVGGSDAGALADTVAVPLVALEDAVGAPGVDAMLVELGVWDAGLLVGELVEFVGETADGVEFGEPAAPGETVTVRVAVAG